MQVTKSQLRVPTKMDAGRLSPWVTAFAVELEGRRHTRLTVTDYARSARHFAAWLEQNHIAVGNVDSEIIDRFARHDCRCGGHRRREPRSRRYLQRVSCFVAFLARQGQVASIPKAVAGLVEPRVADYQEWLLRHRGLCARTVDRHGRMAMRLLTVLGHDPQGYDPASIRDAIVKEARQHSAAYVKTMTTALRGYLRFLAAAGLCPPTLENAVPFVPQWRLSSLPRYLTPDNIERLIGSCDLSATHGVRDRAILLLLARLGLRAGDIFDMRLRDIDWTAGTLIVKGKGRREVRLPLPQDAGDAILAYIDGARPTSDSDRLFLRGFAPFTPFSTSSVVSSVVHRALNRAEIKDPPSFGTNLLRHSAATHMLRGGATLQAVGAVLRHRSIETTAHYAKVDLTMLQQVAQPWPGDWSC